MDESLFEERPELADDVHLRASPEGPLLVREAAGRALLLSELEVGAVACMDGSLTLEAIAAKVLQRFGRVSYAGLVHLVRQLAVDGFLRQPAPSEGSWRHAVLIRRLVDLPLGMLPGVGGVAPRLSARATRPAVLVAVGLPALLLTIPHGLRLLDEPAAGVAIAGSWELAVLALLSIGFVTLAARGLARAGTLRDMDPARPAAGLRLRAGLLAFDVDTPTADAQPPARSARVARAGLLGILSAALLVAGGAWLLPPPYEQAATWALLPWLLLFFELCPFLPTDGARLLAEWSETPAARRDRARALLAGPWWRASLAVLGRDRKALLSFAWLAGALALTLGPLGPAARSWSQHLFASESVPLRLAAALPPIAWTGILISGVALGVGASFRLVLLAREIRRERRGPPRRAMPDEAADRLLLELAPLAVLTDTDRAALATRLLTRVLAPGERVTADSGGLYAVLNGLVALRIDGEERARFGAGDLFAGQRTFRDPGDARVELVALRRCRLRVLQGPEVEQLLDGLPEGREALVDTLLARAALRGSPLFANLGGRALDQLVARCDVVELSRGATLPWSADGGLFVVQAGALAPDHGGQPAGPGDVIGVDGVLDPSSPPGPWHAVATSRLVRVPRPALVRALHRAAPMGVRLEAAGVRGPVLHRRGGRSRSRA